MATTSSSGARTVVSAPVKNSRARTRRSRRRDRSTMVASLVTVQSGISALGSAWATEPPRVPALRVWKCPTHGSASASRGSASRSAAESSASACVTVAPVTTRSPRISTPSRPASREMSITVFGLTMRRFSMGPSVMPPASTAASSRRSASTASASPSESGRTYSNATGFIARPCQKGRGASRASAAARSRIAARCAAPARGRIAR